MSKDDTLTEMLRSDGRLLLESTVGRWLPAKSLEQMRGARIVRNRNGGDCR